jgi:hypothetical protein
LQGEADVIGPQAVGMREIVSKAPALSGFEALHPLVLNWAQGFAQTIRLDGKQEHAPATKE